MSATFTRSVSSRQMIASEGSARVMARPISVRPAVRRSEMARTFRRRRAVVGLLSGLFVIGAVVLGGVIAGPGGVPASASGAGEVVEPMTLVVRSGDTLWSIAHEYRGEIAHGRYVEYLVRLNGGPSVTVGQQLRLP